MSAASRTDPLSRGPWWTVTACLVTTVFAVAAWIYFFVLNRTRIVRPYDGPDDANLMFVANHQSPIDSALIALAAFFPRILFRPRLHPWNAAAAEYWFSNPVIAWLADRLRCLPARAGTRGTGTIRSLCRVLPRGVTVFFPEGKRSRDGTIDSGHAGAGFIALRTGARIVPVAIGGLLSAMPHHAPRPGIGRTFTIAFGDPVEYDDLRARPVTRANAQAVVDRSMRAVQQLYAGLPVPAHPLTHRGDGRRGAAFRNKVVWVTGASSGIGRALALELHRQSATLIISARNVAALERVAALCSGPAPVHVLPLDLTQPGHIADVVQDALRITGHVDYVIHNAGLAARAAAVDAALGVDRQVMETNYFGPVALTKAILPSMLRRKAGTFVVVSSITGKFGAPRMGAYSASKHALHGFFESLRAEVTPDNLRVCIAVPGFVNTPITNHALTGNGDRFGKTMAVHLQGMSPDACARGILDGAAAGRQEFLVGGIEVMAVHLLRVSRRLVAFLVRNHPFRLAERLRQILLPVRAELTADHRIRGNGPTSW